ncbi:MAG TPA: hypothetical protein GX736_03185 [Mogibacterium sp.]|nr:hypothetical protein [Mogibacterium sp.]
MNNYKKIQLIIASFAVISVAMYISIFIGYPFDLADSPESYNYLMLVKAILFGSNIIGDAIIIATYNKNKPD